MFPEGLLRDGDGGGVVLAIAHMGGNDVPLMEHCAPIGIQTPTISLVPDRAVSLMT